MQYIRAAALAAAFLIVAATAACGGTTGTTPLADDPAAVSRADPITYIQRDDPPFLIFHGSADTSISPTETLALHNALRAGGVTSTRYVVEGAAHGDVAFAGDPRNSLQWTSRDVADPLVDFLNRRLRR